MVINDAKFRVCMSNSFGNVKLKRRSNTKWLVGLPIHVILKFKINSFWEKMLLIYPERVINRVCVVNIFKN